MLINFKYYIKTFLNTFAIKKIEKILLAEKVDLIHINSLYSYVAAKAAIKNNIKVIWHIRECLEENQNSKYLNKEKA